MSDMILAIVTLLVLALGASVILLLRRVGHIATQIREAEQRRAIEQTRAVAEVKRILGDVEHEPSSDGEQRRRRHLRAVPVFAGLAAGPLTAIKVMVKWATDYPLPAVGAATVSTAAAVAVLATPADGPNHAMPEPTPPSVQVPDTTGPAPQPPPTVTPPRTPPPRAPVARQRATPTGVIEPPPLPTPPSAPASAPSSGDPTGPPTHKPPDDPDPPVDEPPPCVLHLQILGVAVTLCSGELDSA